MKYFYLTLLTFVSFSLFCMEKKYSECLPIMIRSKSWSFDGPYPRRMTNYELYKMVNKIRDLYQESLREYVPDCEVGFLAITLENQTSKGLYLYVSKMNLPVGLYTPFGKFIFTFEGVDGMPCIMLQAAIDFYSKLKLNKSPFWHEEDGHNGSKKKSLYDLYKIISVEETELRYPKMHFSQSVTQQLKECYLQYIAEQEAAGDCDNS